MTDEMTITKGSKYYVVFGRSENITGIFKGYTMIGSETALMMETDDSLIYVLINKVLSMTLVGPANEPSVKKKEEPGVYYG